MGKNLRTVGGKSLLALTIEAARGARRVQRIVVSTDDDAIAEAAQKLGVDVVMRPAELASDTASSESALLHALEQLQAKEHYDPAVLAFLQCTSPLTLPEDIDGTIAALLEEGADSALAVTSFHGFLWRADAAGEAVGINHDKSVRPMRQQRGGQYLETGAVYAMRTSGFRQARHRFFGKTALYVMPPERVLEIDEPLDLELAEMRVRAQGIGRTGRALPNPLAALAMDFDGVFTDNRVQIDAEGTESVVCSRSDGMGLEMLRHAGIALVVISKERNPVVQRRCEKLQIECVQGVDDKATALRQWCESHGLALESTIFVGNDVNDLDCSALAGCAVAVADAHPRFLRAADLVLTASGGRGALRELSEHILAEREARR